MSDDADPAAHLSDDDDALSTAAAAATSSADASEPPQSKNARKRALKQEKYEAFKLARRQKEKAARKAQQAVKREANQAAWDALTPEEQAEKKKEHALTREHREAAVQAAEAARAAAAAATLPTCVVDLAFDDLMSDREIASLASQLGYCYSAVRKASYPMHLVFASHGGRTAEKLCHGSEHWHVTYEPRHYLDAYARERLVYLSSESEVALGALDPHGVYIVGGLVDHNRHKGLTHQQAVDAGVRTARLPIDEHVAMSQRQVLAVNHVVEILTHRASGLDWAAALMRAMPERRGAKHRGDEEAAEGEGEAAAADGGAEAGGAAEASGGGAVAEGGGGEQGVKVDGGV